MSRGTRARGSDRRFEELAAEFEKRLAALLAQQPTAQRDRRLRALEALWERLAHPLLASD